MSQAEQTVDRFELPASLSFERPRPVGLALADCRLQLVIDEVPIVDFAYDPADGPVRQPTGEPFSIGAVRGGVHVSGWRILRDIYYLPPPGKIAMDRRQLESNEYWLLGDNSAVSSDSRVWPADVRITRDALVGTILRWR